MGVQGLGPAPARSSTKAAPKTMDDYSSAVHSLQLTPPAPRPAPGHCCAKDQSPVQMCNTRTRSRHAQFRRCGATRGVALVLNSICARPGSSGTRRWHARSAPKEQNAWVPAKSCVVLGHMGRELTNRARLVLRTVGSTVQGKVQSMHAFVMLDMCVKQTLMEQLSALHVQKDTNVQLK